MTGKIFRSIAFSAFIVLLCAIVCSSFFLWRGFEKTQKVRMQSEMVLARSGVSAGGIGYLESVRSSDCRFTLIGADGTVLFDSDAHASGMENHAEREEIRAALSYGAGRSERISDTLTVKTMYYAERLPDGAVLRIAIETATVWKMLSDLMEPMIIVIIIAMVLSLVMARFLSRRISEPLNTLDLDHPLENDAYDEISPLLSRIHQQKMRIDEQVDELKRRRDEFSLVTESMNEALVLLNGKGRVVSINRSACNLFGCTDDAVGREFLSIERSYDLSRAIEEASEKGKAHIRKDMDGSIWQIDISRCDLEDRDKGMVILAFDITEESRAEDMRREFTANVSHELKTPLQSIMGAAELIENGLVKDEDIVRFTGKMRKEASRLVTLINDTIRLSEMDEGGSFRKEMVDLRATADDVADALSPLAEKSGIELAVKGGKAPMMGSAQLIYEIIYNLADNAIRYGKKGGHVTIGVADESDHTSLTVEDDGIGIPRKDQGRIFERFYRVDKSHSRDSGGTGLGLSIVKHSALLHGAEIKLESEEDRGTCIRISFPKTATVHPEQRI